MSQISLNKLAYVVENNRKALKLTQDELGDKANINRLMIGRIEKGKYLPSLLQLNSLLSILGVDFQEILEEKTIPNVFIALLGETKTESEKAGFDKMIDMILCLRKHDRLRGLLNERQ